VIEARRASVDDVPAIASLHVDRLPRGFLTTLGPRFLHRLYTRMLTVPGAHVLVADRDDGDIAGFIATAGDTRALYREFLRRDAASAALGSLRAILRAPRQVWETLRYGMGGADDLPPAEILSIAVAPGAAGKGVGGALVARALEEFRADGIDAARVVTVVDNEPALRMYERAGFHRHHVTEVHAGTAQQVLVWP